MSRSRHGIGLRWSFMGPLETIDLNAPGGIADYLRRYGPLYQAIEREQEPLEWAERRAAAPARGRAARAPAGARLAERSAWRDRRLMALAAQKRQAAEHIGE